MAAARTARSRATPAKENGVRLEEVFSVFKSDKFDADAYVQSKCSLNEKDVKQLRSYLLDLKKASAEGMRQSVFANYSAFIRTSKEILNLDGEISSIRNLLSTQATLINGLAHGVNIEIVKVSEDSVANDILYFEDKEHSDLEKWAAEFPDRLDVLLAERRVDEALAAFDEGESIFSQAKEKRTLSSSLLSSLQFAIAERKQKLANQLAEAASQPSTRGGELRLAISALKRLGDGPRAHTLLLNAHFQRYEYNMRSLHPSSASYGGAYTAALSQLVFSAISQASSDSLTIFGKDPAYTSELVTWATKHTEAFSLLVKKHALASSAASGGLRAAAECAQIALEHCSLLEARGLSLCPVLLKHFKPITEQAMEANLKRIEEGTAAMAAADDWVFTYPSAGSRHASTAFQNKLTPSAHRFNLMVQEFFEDAGLLLSMQMGSKALEGLFQVFNSYVNVVISALPGSIEEVANFEGSGTRIVRMAVTEAQQLALLADASFLADELLPRAATKLSPHDPASYQTDEQRRPLDRQNRNPEQREWKRRLLSTVDKLKDAFCRQHALDLIFTEEGESHLSSEMYISMVDGNADDIEWFPSLIFQDLFAKLQRMANLAADMFKGRERFAMSLLMRLTETIILWLSRDQSFWDDIEEGPTPLGPLGLRQLPEDEWFNGICLDVMERLSGKPKGDSIGPNSSTASVSSQSVSSVRSHGSY